MMKKRVLLFYVTFMLFCSYSYSQNKLKVKLLPEKTDINIYASVRIEAYLYNYGMQPVSIFRQDFSEPGWRGVDEWWYVSGDTIPVGFDMPNSNFKESSVIKINPGDSLFVESYDFSSEVPGKFNVKYKIAASRSNINMGYAADESAKNAARKITEFVVESPELVINCKLVNVTEDQIRDISASELNKEKEFGDLKSAFKSPEKVFKYSMGGRYGEALSMDKLKALKCLKNIQSLSLINVYFKDDSAEIDSLLLTLQSFKNLKDLEIEGYDKNQNIEISNETFKGLSKLETLVIKRVKMLGNRLSLSHMDSLRYVFITDVKSDQNFSLDLNSHKLQSFRIWNCNIDQISAISDQPKLKEFILNNLKLTSIQGLNNLPSIKNLFITKNLITEIPSSIGNMPNISMIDLSDNKLTSLPSELVDLSSLNILSLSGNQITHLPDFLKNIPNLKNIILQGNGYSKVEDVLFEIPSLAFLNLSNNNISELPDHFDKLVSLKGLNISDNKVELLPPSLLVPVNLKELNVKGNPIVKDKTVKSLQKNLKDKFIQ